METKPTIDVVKAVSGDSVVGTVDVGVNGIKQYGRWRLWGINSPRVKTNDTKESQKGCAARDYLDGIIKGKNDLPIKVYNEKKRVFIDIFIGGKSVCDLMVKAGYAKKYTEMFNPVFRGGK